MAEADISSDSALIEDWSLRPWLLAGVLALAGFFIHLLVDGEWPEHVRAGLASLVFFSAFALAFTIGPAKMRGPLIFAIAAGLVMGGLAWHWVHVQENSAAEEFAFFAGVFATGLALPLFQAGFHRTKLNTDYKLTHFHIWTDAVTAAGALAFMALSWLMLLLLNGLFGLVGIEILEDLWDEEWFAWMWSGAAFGAALGVLRNNLKIIGTLQNVVLLVLSLLAMPFALGVIVFLIALLLSGGQALWNATDDATPILLACAVGSFIFTNAIIRDEDAARSSNRLLQGTAALLAASVFPLALFAAISMGIRIDQHGLTPERIWALIAISVAVAYGVGYWVGMIRGRVAAWSDKLRRANLHLAVIICILALLLALPWHDFGAVSARDQVARLEAGEVSPEDFDYYALRWDFGDGGRAVLDELAAGEGEIARLAIAAKDDQDRPSYWERRRVDRNFDFRVQSADPAFEELARNYLEEDPYQCTAHCLVMDLGEDEAGNRKGVIVHRANASIEIIARAETQADGRDVSVARDVPAVGGAVEADSAYLRPDSRVEIREISKPYVVIDGVPLSRPLSVGDDDSLFDLIEGMEASE